MKNYKYGISPPGEQDDVNALAFNCYASHDTCIENFITLMIDNFFPEDEEEQKELARQAGIDWDLTQDEIDYIEDKINSVL